MAKIKKKRALDLSQFKVNRKQKTIVGQKLPSEETGVPMWVNVISLSATIGLFLGINYIVAMILGFFLTVSKTGWANALSNRHLVSLFNVFYYPPPFILLVLACLISGYAGFMSYKKLSMRFKKLERGQKGDMRFLTHKEVETNFPKIPHVTKRFEGYGGMPVSHHGTSYFIDQATSNSVVLGISRTGKTEIFIFPLIDILSRGTKQASMIINDVKKEILRGTQGLLERRGYDTYSIDLIDPMRSISVQLFYSIIFYWKLGERDQAELLINSLTYTLYCSPNDSGTSKHFNETAQGVVSAVILSFLEMAEEQDTYEKVTMYNVSQFIVEMGMERWRYKGDPKEYNALDLYFEKLPMGSSAKSQFASTNFAGDREKGSIMSVAIRGLRIFQLKSIAKLTSDNTLDFKKLGFPKDVLIQFDKRLSFQKVKLVFRRGTHRLGEKIIEPSTNGVAMYFHDFELENHDCVDLYYPDMTDTSNTRQTVCSTIVIDKIYQHDSHFEKDYRVDITIEGQHELLKNVELTYCKHPIALYFCVADEDKSLHSIVSILISQIYQTLIKLCSHADNELIRRLHMILEEFGNMPMISGLPNYVTASLGRGILWNFYVQGYHQFYKTFGKDDGKLIIDNCQNVLYVMSKDKGTVDDIWNQIGKKTVEEDSISDKATKIDASRQRRVTAEDVIQKNRLMTLLKGETVVISGLNREDNNGNPIRPFPIFNTQETTMPLRYQFELSKDINPKTALTDLNTPCTHRELDLACLYWDYHQIKVDIGVPYVSLNVPEQVEVIADNSVQRTKEDIFIEIKDILWEEQINEVIVDDFIEAIEKGITVKVTTLLHQFKSKSVLETLLEELETLN